MSHLPKPRGTLSEHVIAALADGVAPQGPAAASADDAEDAALTLWTLYELSYAGFSEVDDRLEWDPTLLGVRRVLEEDLESRLRERWPGPPAYDGDLGDALLGWIDDQDGASLARFVQTRASVDQVMELFKVRSLYHLKEADPTAWSIPRMPLAAKAALAELQYDEYGSGRAERLHTRLFTDGMEALGLDTEPAAYVDLAPLEVLEQNNAMSLFGLHRRLRGASVGHLAAFEATSSGPSRKMAQGLERLGLPGELRDYYTEHVEADAVHEQLAARLVCGALVAAEPETEPDVWFGAYTCLDLESRTATHLLDRWGAEL